MKILMVEDEVLIGMMLERQLKDYGFTIWKRVGSGEEAVEILTTEDVDLILMDIRLAGRISGIEATQAILARKTVPVIFMTAYGTPEIRAQAMATRPLGFLEKPIALPRLVELIKTLPGA